MAKRITKIFTMFVKNVIVAAIVNIAILVINTKLVQNFVKNVNVAQNVVTV